MHTKVMQTLEKVGNTGAKICGNPLLIVAEIFAGLAVIATGNEIKGAFIFILLISLKLFLCSDVFSSFRSLMILSVFLTKCYDSYDIFIKFKWLAIPAVLAIIFHFTIYKKPVKIGPSFKGLVAVAIAITLGGIGSISFSNYFRPVSLYYVFGIGIGMIIAYLLIASAVQNDEKAGEKLAFSLLIAGIVACFAVAFIYFENRAILFETKKMVEFQSANNLGTFLMIALPVTFGLSAKHRRWLPLVVIFYAFIILTGSRGAFVMGSIEYVICLFWYIFSSKRHIAAKSVFLTINIAAVCLVLIYVSKLLPGLDEASHDSSGFISRAMQVFLTNDEPRIQLLRHSWTDFKSNPLFGIGLGFAGHSGAYIPKATGAMAWYHMWFAQIIGSMGIVGIVAYLYQFIGRIFIAFKNRSPVNSPLTLCYVGLFLMSQVNPGEFCPIPYTLIGVFIFIAIENGQVKNKDRRTKLFKKRIKT